MRASIYVLSIFFLISFKITAQKKIDQQEVYTVIKKSSQLVKKYYLSLKTGKLISALLEEKLKDGNYDSIENASQLTTQLTKDLRAINGDMHMSVHYSPKTIAKKTTNNFQLNLRGEKSNYGFDEVKILDGNIGYFKISHFSNGDFFEEHKKVVDSAFDFIKHTDALIIDVRNNKGGYEAIVGYLISYLVESKTHLSDYYVRFNNTKTSLWTTQKLPRKKMPKIPVYVLTNSFTASAGESLAYMLKHMKRGLVFGEITVGAGNGAMKHRVTDNFTVTISSEETINAVTKTSFEGIGVKPDFIVKSELAFYKAYQFGLNQLKKKYKEHESYYTKIIELLPLHGKVSLDKKSLQKYLGNYRGKGLEITIIENNQILYAMITGQKGKYRLIPKNKEEFVVENIKERIRFVFNDKGQVIKLMGIDSPMNLIK